MTPCISETSVKHFHQLSIDSASISRVSSCWIGLLIWLTDYTRLIHSASLMFHFLSLLSMFFIITRLNVLTTHVTVCVCRAELKIYLLTYLLLSWCGNAGEFMRWYCIVKVNASPSLTSTTSADRVMKYKLISDVINIVVPPRELPEWVTKWMDSKNRFVVMNQLEYKYFSIGMICSSYRFLVSLVLKKLKISQT